ncbi:hypothetical protein HN873_038651 [Arachis hypogaea]
MTVSKSVSRGGFRLPFLKEVIVNECKCMTSLFPASVFKNKIQKLDVRNCVKLEEIFGKYEVITAGKDNNKELLMFPCLTTLTLWESPALRCIWSGMQILDWPELKEMDVYHCPELKMFADDLENSTYSNTGSSKFYIFFTLDYFKWTSKTSYSSNC